MRCSVPQITAAYLAVYLSEQSPSEFSLAGTVPIVMDIRGYSSFA